MRAGPSFLLATLLAAACGPKDMSIEPGSGDADGGRPARITGAGFLGHGPAIVYVGAKSAKGIVIEDDAHVSFKTPEAEAFGVVDVRLEFADGTAHTLPGAYTYVQIDGKPLKDNPFRPAPAPGE